MTHTGQIDQWVATAVAVAFGIYVLRALFGIGLSIAAACLGRADGVLRSAADVVTPKLVQRLLAALLGSAALVGSGAVAANAAIPDIDRGPMSAFAHSSASLSPTTPTPESTLRPRDPLKPAPASTDGPPSTQHRTVTVGPGDCLWSLAQQQLGPSATAAAIDRQTHQWYAINRAVIGPNPDLILDGQQLQVPGVKS